MRKPDIVRRIRVDRLRPGDIVLTSNMGATSKLVRRASKGIVSHAMICVQHGSVIDSTGDGVQARNIQRELFRPRDQVHVLRLREPLDEVRLAAVIDVARSEIGTRYSKIEAARAVLPGARPRTRQQFCSRLVARAYSCAGVKLAPDADYCTPEDLRLCSLLVELTDMSEVVSQEELAQWQKRPNPVEEMHAAQNAVLGFARSLDPSVENFGDLDRLVQEHPEWDELIAQALEKSGYLELWKSAIAINPWRYDPDAIEALSSQSTTEELRGYCIDTVREFHTGGLRFSVNLVHHRSQLHANERRATALLVDLYEQLVRTNALRCSVALGWLRQHFPHEADRHLEKIQPHSPLWFSIVDRVQPTLGIVARASIAAAGSVSVCSSCGDPAHEYILMNAAETMPGVPSLSLCSDCIEIRRSGGEILDPI
ncbi:MAG: hypothetical protein LCH80_07720 [Proteobacteria bacterium]|nr:hypothetical protein [Pseudomonadota bacterium]